MSLLSLTILSIVVFSGLIVFLVFALSFVERTLGSKKDAVIDINNGNKVLEVTAGKTLLATLSAKEVFLPSACGGKGTCGECKCKVVDGGGQILPTETGLLSRAQQKEGYRLGCQCRVRQDMKVEIPPAILEIKKYDCIVRSNRNVATFIKELVLELPEPMTFNPGEYVQLDVPPHQLSYRDFDIDPQYHADWEKYGFWNLSSENDEEMFRAYSMANHPAEQGLIILNVRIATPPPKEHNAPPGVVSSYIFQLKPGDRVRIAGPFGEFHIKDTDREMIFIGGGAGMAPLHSQLFHLFRTLKTGRKISFWYGAHSRQEIFYEEDFRALEREFDNFSFHIALSEPLPEDDWSGPRGFIHQVLYDQYLKDHAEPEEVEYYLCGPPLMIAAVQQMLDSLGVSQNMIAFDDFGE